MARRSKRRAKSVRYLNQSGGRMENSDLRAYAPDEVQVVHEYDNKHRWWVKWVVAVFAVVAIVAFGVSSGWVDLGVDLTGVPGGGSTGVTYPAGDGQTDIPADPVTNPSTDQPGQGGLRGTVGFISEWGRVIGIAAIVGLLLVVMPSAYKDIVFGLMGRKAEAIGDILNNPDLGPEEKADQMKPVMREIKHIVFTIPPRWRRDATDLLRRNMNLPQPEKQRKSRDAYLPATEILKLFPLMLEDKKPDNTKQRKGPLPGKKGKGQGSTQPPEVKEKINDAMSDMKELLDILDEIPKSQRSRKPGEKTDDEKQKEVDDRVYDKFMSLLGGHALEHMFKNTPDMETRLRGGRIARKSYLTKTGNKVKFHWFVKRKMVPIVQSALRDVDLDHDRLKRILNKAVGDTERALEAQKKKLKQNIDNRKNNSKEWKKATKAELKESVKKWRENTAWVKTQVSELQKIDKNYKQTTAASRAAARNGA